jgi:TonB family protein
MVQPNSALDRSSRSVTPVADGQRARQSVPPVSASVRRNVGPLLQLFLLALAIVACAHRRPMECSMCGEATVFPLLHGTAALERLVLIDPDICSDEPWLNLTALPRFEYPRAAELARVQGAVEIEGLVVSDGSVDRPTVVRSPSSWLDDAALRGISNLHFRRWPSRGPLPVRTFHATVLFTLH